MTAMLVYVKTPKGIEEINSHTHGLSQQARQVLILLDGKHSHGEIVAMFPDGNAEALLAEIAEGGFIVPLQPAPAEPVAPGKRANRYERPLDSAQRYEMAKNFMRNTVNAYLGGMGSSFVSQLDECTSIEELRSHYKTWQETIQLSRDGRKQIPDLERRLAALLS